MSNDSDILNAISDLRAANDDKEELESRIKKLKDELEGAEDDLQGTELEIERAREKLDELIDEATGTRDKDIDYSGALRSSWLGD